MGLDSETLYFISDLLSSGRKDKNYEEKGFGMGGERRGDAPFPEEEGASWQPTRLLTCKSSHTSTMQCNAIQCKAIQCKAIQCNAMQCNAMHNLMGCYTVQCTVVLHLRYACSACYNMERLGWIKQF